MRLIDAENFSKAMKGYFTEMITHHKYNVDCVDCNADLQHLLDEQPTTYDVDKVVEELKKHKDTTDLNTVDEEMVVGFTVYQGAFNDAIDKAIEIVKHGGVSDDVCEWREEGLFLYTSCGDRVNAYSDDFKYCPYCSKQIKVVE